MDPLDLLVIYGSVRGSRQGIKAAKFIAETCRGRGHKATLIDPAEDTLPLLDRMYKEYKPGEAPRPQPGTGKIRGEGHRLTPLTLLPCRPSS